LVEKFDYTHEMVARKLGKSRSSITEAMSLLSIPADVRELCRRADITSKTILLQIARQPNVESMIKLIERIGTLGLTRDQVRQAKNPEDARKPFQFKYQPENKDFKLEIKFRRDNVSRDELITVLEDLLASIRSQEE
jgi:ParB family chromosome partitioning protein